MVERFGFFIIAERSDYCENQILEDNQARSLLDLTRVNKLENLKKPAKRAKEDEVNVDTAEGI